ncbi:hypothetical protein MAC_04783 [Metarhizium acridum CQMa 102]|uniref:Fungal specific transcription factor n=1 Tax=Metarhizium acridum (strain CQMa 102) TaxID=655827 RepID=E9E4I5_METAQ|nr:uncharacterized protein MAC_04783 [Metarhizium acridum CQMa 102]EFY89196.1 hypothetical protein MAC_04783 [Metarhizium acridum CQMa 102]
MRDVHFRVYWTLCRIDVWSSDGMNLQRQMALRKDVPLPMDEETFLNLSPQSPGTVDMIANPDRNNSLLAQMIKLNSILIEANDYMKDITTTQPAPVSKDRVAGLSLKLDNWLAALPNHMHDTAEPTSPFDQGPRPHLSDAAMATPGCDVKYTMVDHITVTASSIHIHTPSFETDEKQICEARDQLEGNFNHLLGLEILGCTGSLLSTTKDLDTSYRMDR